MLIGNKEFDVQNKTYIMGILNITPDSFSDGGKWNSIELAQKHIEEMITEGMDILDIGGESTRPGYTLLSDQDEIDRLIPIIRMVKRNFDIPISIDTYKSKIAAIVLEEGVDMINDIWGLKYDSDMATIIASFNATCCLMHNRTTANYSEFYSEMLEDLQDSLLLAQKAKIKKEKIILDPGVGFGKTYENNLEAIASLDKMHSLGYPILLGTSRKSVIGLTLDLPVSQRLEGTLATTVLAVLKGAAFVRVHDVKENKRAIHMTETILNTCNYNKN